MPRRRPTEEETLLDRDAAYAMICARPDEFTDEVCALYLSGMQAARTGYRYLTEEEKATLQEVDASYCAQFFYR